MQHIVRWHSWCSAITAQTLVPVLQLDRITVIISCFTRLLLQIFLHRRNLCLKNRFGVRDKPPWNDVTAPCRRLYASFRSRCYPSLALCLASSITQRKIKLEAWTGHGALAGLTWLRYRITQPAGRPPVKSLPGSDEWL